MKRSGPPSHFAACARAISFGSLYSDVVTGKEHHASEENNDLWLSLMLKETTFLGPKTYRFDLPEEPEAC